MRLLPVPLGVDGKGQEEEGQQDGENDAHNGAHQLGKVVGLLWAGLGTKQTKMLQMLLYTHMYLKQIES